LDFDTKYDALLKAIHAATRGIDGRTLWPGSGAQIYSSVIDLLAMEIITDLENAKKRLSLKELSRLFYSPSLIRYVIAGEFLIGSKVLIKENRITFNRAKSAISLLMKILENKTYSDPFCSDKKNLYISPKKVDSVIRKGKLNKVNKDGGKIAELIVNLNGLIWSNYYDIFIARGMEIGGPYKFGECTVIVRDYFDIFPDKIWPSSQKNMKKLGIKSLKIYLGYKNIDWKIDYFMHELNPIPPSKLQFWIGVIEDTSGRKRGLNDNDIDKLLDKMPKMIIDQVKYVNKLPIKEKIKKGIELSYYQLNHLHQFASGSQKVPDYILKECEKSCVELWKKYDWKNRDDSYEKIDWSELYDIRKSYIR